MKKENINDELTKFYKEKKFKEFLTEKKRKEADNAFSDVDQFKWLVDNNYDPILFTDYCNTMQDKDLKKKFGKCFILMTLFFCVVSYAIIILNFVLKWGISNVAITGLIIETPLQFIGLLYIIANNLFPSPNKIKKEMRKIRTKGEKES